MLREAGEKLREAVFEAEVFAVAGGVLADQIDLAHALFEEASGFRDHGFETAAAEVAAILRDHAEGAGVIAALGDLQVREVARCGENARREVVIEVRRGCGGRFVNALADGDNALDFVGADERVDFRHVLFDVAAIALHEAAGDDQALRLADLLVLGHFENGVDGFLLGGVDEAAGVDDEDVGLIGMRGELMAASGRAGPS